MAKKKSTSEALVDAFTIYCNWIDAVLSECELNDADRSTVRSKFVNKPPAAYIVDNYIQARFSNSLAKKQAILAQIQETDDREKIQNGIAQIKAIEQDESNTIWHP